MPLVRISLRRGKAADYHAALRDGIYRAMRETFAVPEGDCFVLIHQHDEGTFFIDPDYLGIHRTKDAVVVQITCNDTRTVDQKKALYSAIVKNWGSAPSVKPGDVFINLVEVKPENWSFGNGDAPYAGK